MAFCEPHKRIRRQFHLISNTMSIRNLREIWRLWRTLTYLFDIDSWVLKLRKTKSLPQLTNNTAKCDFSTGFGSYENKFHVVSNLRREVCLQKWTTASHHRVIEEKNFILRLFWQIIFHWVGQWWYINFVVLQTFYTPKKKPKTVVKSSASHTAKYPTWRSAERLKVSENRFAYFTHMYLRHTSDICRLHPWNAVCAFRVCSNTKKNNTNE